MTQLGPGTVAWVDLDPTQGREQAGRRPAVVIATTDYLKSVPALAVIVPVTTTDRGWPHHVMLRGDRLTLAQASFAMTEQPRTISRKRILGEAGSIDSRTLATIRRWISDFLVLEA